MSGYSGSLEDIEQLLLVNCWDCAKDAKWLIGLRPTDFSCDAARNCFVAVRDLLKKSSEDLSMMVVLDVMRRAGQESHAASMLSYWGNVGAVEGTASIRSMVAHIREEGTWRRLAKCYEYSLEAIQTRKLPLEAMQEKLAKDLNAVFASRATSRPMHEREAFLERAEQLEQRERDEQAGKARPIYLPTGYAQLDARHPIQLSEFIVLSGGPKEGKSSLMLKIVRNWAKLGPGYLWSGEMKREQIVNRAAAQTLRERPPSKVTAEDCREMVERHLTDLYIDTDVGLTASEICQRLRLYKQEHPDMLFAVIDYMGLTYSHKYAEASDGVWMYRAIALELGIVVLGLIHVNPRKVLERKDPTPLPSDLRDAGTIDQDASKILSIHRPWVWNKGRNKNEAILFVLLDREGEPEEIPMHWDGAHVLYTEVEAKPEADRRPELREGYEYTDDDQPYKVPLGIPQECLWEEADIL